MDPYLGIDTSNYTTSVALFCPDAGVVIQRKKLLPVEPGKLGLRQSDAVFAHVKQLGDLVAELMQEAQGTIRAVGVSVSPRDEEESYMPCFLVGKMAAESIAAVLRVPCFAFSHQGGHVAAALYASHSLDRIYQPQLAFHLSGGTTQCLLASPDPERVLRIQTVSGTLDLNAGQVVDRVGGMLGLSFPAGSALEELASRSQEWYTPKPTFKGLDCCLSGLENLCRKRLEDGEQPCDIARFCLDYLAQTVLELARRALEQHPGLPLVFAGGVMSNRLIQSLVAEEFPDACFAPPEYSCDNAAGIAVLAAIRQGGACGW